MPDHSVSRVDNLPELEVWLKDHIEGFQGPLEVEFISGGQSNPTYLLHTPNCKFVMRTKPGPAAKLLPSAHAIEREFRVLQALYGSAVPVAQPLALCEDESVIGRAFYVMAFMDGRVLWDQSLPGFTPTDRRALFTEMNRTLANLHLISPSSVGLQDYGRAGNYFERQISRWSKQYQQSVTQPIEAMDELIDWLPKHTPASAKSDRLVSIVHGDYRLDNLMFAKDSTKAVAVLDWELSTIGHPLADFSYHCMSWHIEPGTFRGIAGLDLEKLGIPSEQEYISMYCHATGFVTPDELQQDWHFYLAYNLFRIAAILQGIAKRIEAGTASNPQAIKSAAGARPLAEKALHYARLYRS